MSSQSRVPTYSLLVRGFIFSDGGGSWREEGGPVGKNEEKKQKGKSVFNVGEKEHGVGCEGSMGACRRVPRKVAADA